MLRLHHAVVVLDDGWDGAASGFAAEQLFDIPRLLSFNAVSESSGSSIITYTGAW